MERNCKNNGEKVHAWHIEEKTIRDFLRRYPEELNARNVDMIMVVDILAGVTNQH